MDTKTLTTGIGTAILTAVATVLYIGSPIPKDQTTYRKIDDSTVEVTKVEVFTSTRTLNIDDIKKNLDAFNKAVEEVQAKEPLSQETQERIQALRAVYQVDLDTARQAGLNIKP